MDDKILSQSSRYDILEKIFPGIALICLVARFTKFCNYTTADIIFCIPISFVIGICIDALGSLLGQFFVTQNMQRADYSKYREVLNSKEKGINIYMLEIRRVMCRNVAVMLLLFLIIKIYEIHREYTFSDADIFIMIITFTAICLCTWKSRHIDEYKQKRIEIYDLAKQQGAQKKKQEKADKELSSCCYQENCEMCKSQGVITFCVILLVVMLLTAKYKNVVLVTLSQIAAIVSCLGIVVGVLQYSFSVHSKKDEEIRVALDLWRFYTEAISPKANFVTTVLDTFGRNEKIDIVYGNMQDFTKKEIDSIGRATWELFDEDVHSERSKNTAREIVKIACLLGIAVIPNECACQYNNACKRSEAELHETEPELISSSFVQIKKILCEKLDYFARSVLCMALNRRILKGTLQQEYLKVVRYLYLEICDSEGKYPNIVKLYNKWNTTK